MKNIEITTSQNVTVQYGLAAVWERGLALSFDLMIMGVFMLVTMGFQTFLFPSSYDIVFYFVIAPVIVLYSLLFEMFNNGQSPGKRILKLRVIRMDGEKADFLDYLMRWIFRGLDIYFSFTGIGILSIVSSRYSQRLGDLLANTVVVNVGKNERMPLQNLLKFNKMNKESVTYPQITKIPESAMVIVKETLARNQLLGNAAHDDALKLLAQKMEDELNVRAGNDKRVFLQTLLKDYIHLTR